MKTKTAKTSKTRSAKTKSAKTKTAKTKSARTRKTAAKGAGNAGMAKAHKAKQALTGRLESMGLLDQGTVERMEKKTEGLLETSGSGLEKCAAWDRALAAALADFEAGGLDANASKTLQAMIVWQESLLELPSSVDGLNQAVQSLKKVVPFHGASLCLRHPDRMRVEPVTSVGFPVELIGRIRFSEGIGFSSWVASRKKPVLYSSLHRNEAPGSEQVRSFMAVPLVVGGECLGVLNLGHREDGAYDPSALRRLILASGALAGLAQRVLATEQIQAREIQNPDTGLATPGYFRRRLDEEVVRCRDLGHSMSLVVIRLRELEEFSSQFGEDFRTRCRTELAQVAQSWREPSELIGHGADESLVVLMPSARREKAESRAEALALALRRHNFPRRKRMTVGVGIGTYPADAEGSQELLEWVDKASYEAPRDPSGNTGVSQPIAL